MAKVDVIECPSCSSKVAISPLSTQAIRGKRCDNPICNADFSFANNELVSVDVPDDLALRGYFTDADLIERKFRAVVYTPKTEAKTDAKPRKKNLKGMHGKYKRRSRRPWGRGR